MFGLGGQVFGAALIDPKFGHGWSLSASHSLKVSKLQSKLKIIDFGL